MDKVIKTCSACRRAWECLPDKHGTLCRPCKNEKQKVYRENNENSCTKSYEKTDEGYVMRTYRNMVSRVKGILKSKAHLYQGKEILSKSEFYTWTFGSVDFKVLMQNYRESNFDMRFAPSIDRIDTTGGYTLSNMRWITHSENSALGALSQRRFK